MITMQELYDSGMDADEIGEAIYDNQVCDDNIDPFDLIRQKEEEYEPGER